MLLLFLLLLLLVVVVVVVSFSLLLHCKSQGTRKLPVSVGATGEGVGLLDGKWKACYLKIWAPIPSTKGELLKFLYAEIARDRFHVFSQAFFFI